jgi:hypothetical protein
MLDIGQAQTAFLNNRDNHFPAAGFWKEGPFQYRIQPIGQFGRSYAYPGTGHHIMQPMFVIIYT